MQKILIQLDTDSICSSFDRVVAVDAGVDQLLSYANINVDNVEALVHGAIFTRSPENLHNTAIFIGGSDVNAGEELLKKVSKTFFGPMQVSVLLDSNGSNTTAAAAVVSASRHLDLGNVDALILGGTGPVGRRCAQILASQGARVRVASRSLLKAQEACQKIKQLVEGSKVCPYESTEEGIAAAVDGVELIIAAGAAGVQFLTADEWQAIDTLKVAIDLNAVPPLGLEGIDAIDKGVQKGNVVCYGAVGVGGLKIKTHKEAIKQLFTSNTFTLKTTEIYKIASQFA